MTLDQIIEKIQETELVAWNDWRRTVEVYGESEFARQMKYRHDVIRDLMQALGIQSVSEIVRIPWKQQL